MEAHTEIKLPCIVIVSVPGMQQAFLDCPTLDDARALVQKGIETGVMETQGGGRNIFVTTVPGTSYVIMSKIDFDRAVAQARYSQQPGGIMARG